jgi:Uma2 family endonuclease
MSSIGTKKLTFDEWQALPETKQRCEVVDGVLTMPPSPLGEHQWLDFEIAVRLRNFVEERGLGLAITAPYDILIQREPLRTRQPDILVVNAELTGIARPSDLVGRRFLESPPLLVVEVISPGNTRREIEEKLVDYRSIGVPECWLVNFPSRSVEVLRLTAEAATIIATFGMGDTLRSDVLPGFTLPIADIFGPLLR